MLKWLKMGEALLFLLKSFKSFKGAWKPWGRVDSRLLGVDFLAFDVLFLASWCRFSGFMV